MSGEEKESHMKRQLSPVRACFQINSASQPCVERAPLALIESNRSISSRSSAMIVQGESGVPPAPPPTPPTRLSNYSAGRPAGRPVPDYQCQSLSPQAPSCGPPSSLYSPGRPAPGAGMLLPGIRASVARWPRPAQVDAAAAAGHLPRPDTGRGKREARAGQARPIGEEEGEPNKGSER